jgi:serine/threonine protein kinase
VQILDLGQVDGIWYIAMEYVNGRDLGATLRRARKKGLCLPVPHTVFIAIELLKGLEYAHQRQVMRGGRPVALNIIHRDVSPPNILLSFQGEVKLTDFGIARASLKAMETVSGIVKGRFDYMSPEQAAGSKDLDQRSDLFSVGVVLYEMLTGHHPFRTDNEIGTIERVRTGKYTPVSQRNPEVPFTLETIVDRALQVDREDRYPSATAFKEALDKFFHDAGFIFTHATLASYVRGLFPEATQRGNKQTMPAEADTTAKRNRASLSDPEGPTRRLDKRKLHQLRAPPNQPKGSTPPTTGGLRVSNPTGPTSPRVADTEPTAIRPSPLEDFLSMEEQETVIRKVPDSWDDDVATALKPQVWSDDEQETIIRTGADPDDYVPPPTNSGRTSPGRKTPAPSSRKRRAPTRIGWLGWLLTLISLSGGVMLGVMITAVAGLIAVQYMPSAVATDPDPRIEVVAPEDTMIKIDEDVVGQKSTVTPGQAHTIEITLRDREPWKTEFTMQPGQRQVFIISEVPLKPKAP